MAYDVSGRVGIAMQAALKGDDKLGRHRAPPDRTCKPGYIYRDSYCYDESVQAWMRREYESNRAFGFLPTLYTVGPVFVAGFATLLSLGTASPALGATLATAKAVGQAAVKVGLSVIEARPQAHALQQVTRLAGGSPMGFDLGGLLNIGGRLLSGASGIPGASVFGDIAQTFAPAFSPSPFTGTGSTVPVVQRMPVPSPMPMPRQPMGGGGFMRGRGLSGLVLNILANVAAQLGRKHISLNQTVAIIRKMGKFLLEPAAIAVALGIGVGELAELITAHAQRPRRHMNPANGKALRRAARRIKSFHRMCGTIDLLKSRGRRSRSFVAVGGTCQTCRKRPCRC